MMSDFLGGLCHEHPSPRNKLKLFPLLPKASAFGLPRASLASTARRSARLPFSVGRGCAELHDRMMVGIRVNRIECDELWSYVGHKRNPQRKPSSPVKGDQYTFIALGASTRAIIGYRTGKRDTEMTDDFIQDLRQRVIGAPEISTDGCTPTRSRSAMLSASAPHMASSTRPIG